MKARKMSRAQTFDIMRAAVLARKIMMALVLALPKGMVPTLRGWALTGWTLARRGRGAARAKKPGEEGGAG